MIERFEGDDGRRRLLEALIDQKIVNGNTALAEEIAAQAAPAGIKAGTVLIEQDAADNDLYLVLAGKFDVLVNGTCVGQRGPGDHIGEMAAILVSQKRSAANIATEDSVVLKLTEPQLSQLAEKYPAIWRILAKELARRLLQRNNHVGKARTKANVFIISSLEALEIARAIQTAFEYDPFNVIIWTDGVFRASTYSVESLERQLDDSDFAIAIVQPDDTTKKRDGEYLTPRDNVIFELGLFVGRLSRHRTFLFEPRDQLVELPSDLKGITTVPYKYDKTHLVSALGPACNKVRAIINELGPDN